ncbi:hypothetical protein [Chelativorans sp. AA-79]|uniref:hypothetical protein n=1 Tax=Chelativorans sp. AA-79 TaxID=3028735 RepID=UPI0023F645FF|nr:hypothetical protein [Chelativorans sp. AA-79]WEX09490.1 hypothetical protein PVE73_00505 [Chelativorans sp. AA-79]
MVPALAAVCAALMMALAALRGFRRKARPVERLYSLATGGWSALGAAIYYPALYGRWAPVGLAHSHLLVTVFGFGLVLLGVVGASLLIGD